MRDADTAFSACASGDTLAMGISPKFWHDPVTRIYRFVPTNPKVGSHPERSPAKPSAAGRGGSGLLFLGSGKCLPPKNIFF